MVRAEGSRLSRDFCGGDLLQGEAIIGSGDGGVHMFGILRSWTCLFCTLVAMYVPMCRSPGSVLAAANVMHWFLDCWWSSGLTESRPAEQISTDRQASTIQSCQLSPLNCPVVSRMLLQELKQQACDFLRLVLWRKMATVVNKMQIGAWNCLV